MMQIWRVATQIRTRTRHYRQTTITSICLCRAMSSFDFLVVFSFFSQALLSFTFFSTNWLVQGGFFYGLFVVGGVHLGFRVGFLLFHGFFLVGFYPFACFLGFLCWAASTLSLWVVVLLFHVLSCLLLCTIASLLCLYLLIVFLILSVALYSLPISYLTLRFNIFSSLLILFLECGR